MHSAGVGWQYDRNDAPLQRRLERQHLFFVATAPLSADGRPMPATRARTLRALAAPGIDPHDGDALLALPGIGRWTADEVRMRLGDPDVFLATDLHIRRHGVGGDGWRPWRSYATHLLWAA